MRADEFSRQPFDVVAELIAIALNPALPPAHRAAACDAIRGLPSAFLKRLALDADWRHLLGILASDEGLGDLSGDGPWSTLADADPVGAAGPPTKAVDLSNSSAFPAVRPIVSLFAPDLRVLLQADYRPDRPVLLAPMPPRVGRWELIERCAAADPLAPAATPGYVRAISWTATDFSSPLLTFADWWPARVDLQEAYWDEVITRGAAHGLPRPLCRAIRAVTMEREERQSWIAELLDSTHDCLDAQLYPFLDKDALVTVLMRLRAGAAHAVRRAEYTDPHLIAIASLAVVVTFFRRTIDIDLREAWAVGRGDPVAALKALRTLGRETPLRELAAGAMFTHPTERHLHGLGTGDLQALRFLKRREEDIPELFQDGLLVRLAAM